MNQLVRHTCMDEVNRVFSETEVARKVSIDQPVRSFLSNLIVESLATRQQEWDSRASLSPDSAAHAEDIAKVVGYAVRDIVQEAELDSSPDGRRLLLINVLQRIRARWCGIFPFCR